MPDSDNDAPAFNKEGLKNTLLVALGVCLVCSIVVSSAAVVLKPQQQANKELDQKQNILRAAGMLPADGNQDAEGRGVDELFGQFTVRAVDLETGRFVDDVDVTAYNPIKAAKKPASSRDLSAGETGAAQRLAPRGRSARPWRG